MRLNTLSGVDIDDRGGQDLILSNNDRECQISVGNALGQIARE